MNRLTPLANQPRDWAPDLDPQPNHARRSHDAQLALRELRVLREDVDLAVAPFLADAAEPLVDRYQGHATVGDHLRLPRRTNLDATAMRAAMRRFLAVDTSSPGGSREVVQREAKLHRVISALDRAAQMIGRRAAEGANR